MVQLSRSLSIHPSEECLGALREIVGGRKCGCENIMDNFPTLRLL